MNKKLKVTLIVLDNIACKYPDTKICFEENQKYRRMKKWKRK